MNMVMVWSDYFFARDLRDHHKYTKFKTELTNDANVIQIEAKYSFAYGNFFIIYKKLKLVKRRFCIIKVTTKLGVVNLDCAQNASKLMKA